VSGAETDESARRVGFAIANSPLVKTAIAGGDANGGVWSWRSARQANPRTAIGCALISEDTWSQKSGQRADTYDEGLASRAVSGREVAIGVDLGVGAGRARVWTCDLTEGYIRVNASYRS